MDFIFQYLQDSITELVLIALCGGIVLGALLLLVLRRRQGRS